MSIMSRSWMRLVRAAVVAVLATGSFAVAVEQADARGGRGGNIGSRGSNTFNAPPATNTAPGGGSTINRSITQPGQAARPTAAQSATQTAGAAQTASRFGGMKGLLLGGLIGAGLATFLGAGTLASVLGFLLQMLLIAGIVMLVIAFFRSRAGAGNATGPAMATATAAPATAPAQQQAYQRTAAGLGGAGAGLTIAQADYNAFERLLGEVQGAYGRNDLDALGERVTPEMLSYFAGELDDNARKGVINEVGEVKLLQGDLAEAWREGTVDYATVAMRYSIVDAVVESRTGRVVSGSKTEPQQVTEIWTFRRPAGADAGKWELSAIQQTA